MSSTDTLAPQHLPGRSRTKSAWEALIVLFFIAALWIFHLALLRTSVRTILWATRPFTGLSIKSRRLQVAFGKPLRWDKVTITSGQPPYQSQYELKSLSLTLTSPWRIFFGDHVLVDSIEASGGKGLIDLRTQKNQQPPFFSEQARSFFCDFLQKKMIPSTIVLNDLSFILMAEDQRYNVSNFSFSNKNSNQLSYTAIAIEAGGISCHLPQEHCEASWDGKTMTLKNLPLTDEIILQHLQLTPEADHISFGLTSEIFKGIIRADGSFSKNDSGPMIDAAILGQQLPLDHLSKFLGSTKKISGNLREGRLTFRGSPFHIIDAEASLRMIADNFHWEKRGWASLSVIANLIGRKISVTDFQLKQHDNRVAVSGEMTLPTDWHNIAQAPFLLKIKATIPDASQCADLMGPPWNEITGKLFIDGEIKGAENLANGYLNAQGSAMTAYSLPIDSLKLQLLFQGKKTDLASLDIWSESDHLQASGIIENGWPHHYEGKGKINSGNVAKQLTLLRMNEDHLISNGALEATWQGDGTATNHSGSFNLSLYQMTLASQEISGHWNASYTPEQCECPTFMLQENENKLTTALTLSQQGITLKNIALSHDEQKTLSGNIFLPINAASLFHGNSWSHALIPTTPCNIDLALHHLPLHDLYPLTLLTFFPFRHFRSSELLDSEEGGTSIFSGLLNGHQDLLNIYANDNIQGFLSGKIEANGLWNEPSLQLALQGENIFPNPIFSNSKEKKQSASFTITMNGEKGQASLAATLHAATEKPITLQGSFPLAPTLDHKNTPQENIHLGPANAPLHLRCSIPQLSLDSFASKIFPEEVHLTQGIAAGELAINGTLGEPDISGHLQLQAEKLMLGTLLTPLYAAHAKFLLTPGKAALEEASATMGSGKISITGSSDIHSWKKSDHNYHLIGKQLSFYQKTHASAIGNADLSLQCDNSKGCLQGVIDLTNITWKPQLYVTPFLMPPGIIISDETTSTNTSITSSWTTDIVIKNSTEKTALGKSNLHLMGNIFSPTLEGNIALNHLEIKFPQADIPLLQGSLNFNTAHPWAPEPDVTGIGFLDGKKMSASISSTANHRSLFFESDLTLSQETLALMLAMPRDSTQATPGWIEELPYWLRQQDCENPITSWNLLQLPSSSPRAPDGLGFSSHAVSYSFELE